MLLVAGLAILAVLAYLVLGRGPATNPAHWARLAAQDVHSLAFVNDDTQHVLFGHHGGVLESLDGGRTWQALPVHDDAMGMRPAADGSIVIAGHEVLSGSRDGGRTWAPIVTDLPNLDIHGFARDPGDSSRMWANLATGGLWESVNFGANWTRVRDDNVLYLFAVNASGGTRLFGVDASGLSSSADGGRTWVFVGAPPAYPITSFTASADGKILYVGSLDGLYRSADDGRSWARTGYSGSAFALATSADGSIVALVSQGADFFRSPDSGGTWPGPG